MSTAIVTDHLFSDLNIENSFFKPAGIQLIEHQCKDSPQKLREAVAGADYIINQFARIDAEAIARMDKAKIIVRYGIGVDNVDLNAAKEAGIPVCNVPEFCIDEVADHTLAFILATNRQVVVHANAIRAGLWKLMTPISSFHSLSQQTVGVVGFGRIGREVVNRLKAFKAKVLVFDPVVSQDQIIAVGATPVGSLNELMAGSEIVTLHCPSMEATRQMINTESLAAAKPGMTLINVGRGDLVDTKALIVALNSGQVGMAMLDVCDQEPIPLDHPFRKMDQVIMAPHIASVSTKAVTRLRESVARHVLRAHQGEPLVNVVNGISKSRR